MQYRCLVCGREETTDFREYVKHTEGHIIEMIKQKHPAWIDKDGVCRKCAEYYRRQIKGE
jgi:hypothetical protein